MADRNEVYLEGTLTKAPEIRYTSGGKTVTSLNLVTVSAFGGREIKNYHDITAWGDEVAAKLTGLDADSRLSIKGRLVKSSYDGKDGKKVWTVKVNAHAIETIGGQAPTTPPAGDDIPW